MLGENPEFSLLDNFTAKNAQVSEKTRKEAAPPTKSTHSHSAVTFSSSKSTQQYEVPIKKLKMDISKPAVPSPTIIKQKSTAPSKPIPVTSSPSNLLFSKEENSGETTRNVENMKNAAPTNSLKSILQMVRNFIEL
jgi:hypothetical protein